MVKKTRQETQQQRNYGAITKIIKKSSFVKSSNLQTITNSLCELENSKYALCLSSGSAILGAILNTLSRNDHIIMCDDVYGGTRRYTTVCAMEPLQLQVDYLDLTKIDKIEEYINKNTKIIWIEGLTNPTLKAIDIKQICKIANKHNIISIVDNTFSTSIITNPLNLGADIVTNSGTKYIGGHSDVIFGTLGTNQVQLYKSIKEVAEMQGTLCTEFECSLAIKGIKTLQLRMMQHSQTALQLSTFLEQSQMIKKVLYPGLKSHPQHTTAIQQMQEYSGMISFYLNTSNLDESRYFMKQLKITTCAESLGGVHSLIELPAIMTHGSLKQEDRDALGINHQLCRLSCGIENYKDLEDDFRQALDKLEEYKK